MNFSSFHCHPCWWVGACTSTHDVGINLTTHYHLLMGLVSVGLVTKLTDDQKYGMIEAIAHLIHRDYPAIVKDFVKLDFIPDGVNLDPILPVLAKVFDQALEGGGAKNINFQELASDLAQITFDYPFRIPPYFALIIRAIGVLEGIALVGNPEFAIVDEAYPYIAQVSGSCSPSSI